MSFLILSLEVVPRDVPRNEREKTGMGNKLERPLFFPFPSLHFLTTLFSRFWRKSSETGEKSGGTGKKAGKMWKGEERPFHAVPNCQIWRDSIFYAV